MVLGNEDGVGLHALAHLPGEQQLVHFLVGGLTLGGNSEFIRRFGHGIGGLGQNAAVDRAIFNANRGIHATSTQNTQVLLHLQKLKRSGLEARSNNDLNELLVRIHMLDHFERNLDVCRDNAAKSALRITRERLVVSLGDRSGRSRTAGVLVLQNNHGRLVELASERPARIGIENVVVGKLLAVELFGIHEAMRVGIGQAVERSALMRVFAIAQVLLLLEVKVDNVGSLLAEIGLAVELLVHPSGNRAVVGIRSFEHLQRELRTRLARGGAVVGAHFLKNDIVGGGLGDHGNALEILRSIDGPPMSIFSMQVPKSAPEATVFSKAYRFTTTMSIILMPCSSASAICLALSRFASRPPCTMGCSVFTRPSIISGKFVTASMGVTSTPASAITFAVPPVEIISAPNSSCKARANSTTPVLSVTETRTRLTWGLVTFPPPFSFR